ncbi:MAG: DinB family protein [Spirochaeta sp.]|jgi:hypothetical protein|nr:DinB family protein [Spirochaeta sp.]
MTKESLHTELSAARTATLSMIEAVDEAIRSRVPAGHTWSALMVLDHLRILDEQVAAVTQRLAARAKKGGAEAPPDELVGLRELDSCEDGVMDAPSVPGMEPRDPAPATVMTDAAAARAKLISAVENVWAVDCRERRFPHPWLGPMNAYEWLHFAAVHERGHHAHLRTILAAVEER